MAMRATRIIAGYAIVLACALGCATRGPVSAYDLVGRDPFAGVGNAPPPALDLDNPADLAWTLLELDAALVGDPAREEIRARVVAHELAKATEALARGDDDDDLALEGLVTIASLWRIDELEQGRVAGLAPVADFAEAMLDRFVAHGREGECAVALAVLLAADPVRGARREGAYRAIFPGAFRDEQVATSMAAQFESVFPSPWMFAEFQRRWDPAWRAKPPTRDAIAWRWSSEFAALANPTEQAAILDAALDAVMTSPLRARRWCRTLSRPLLQGPTLGRCSWAVAESAMLLAERGQVQAAVERLEELTEYGADATAEIGQALALARAAIATQYLMQGDRAEAQAWVDLAQAAMSTPGRVRGVVGYLAYWQGAYEEAAALFDLAGQAEGRPWHRAELRIHEVRSLMLAGKPTKARAVIAAVAPDLPWRVQVRMFAVVGDDARMRSALAQVTDGAERLASMGAVVEAGDIDLAHELWELARPSFDEAGPWAVKYATILLVAVDRARRRPVAPQMLAILQADSGQPWVDLLGRYVAGDVPFAAVLDASADRGERTEALFYEALLAHGRGELANAQLLLRAVVAGGPPRFTEYVLARRWLGQGILR